MKEPDQRFIELSQQAIDVLVRELGITNTVKFLRQYAEFGTYTAQRDELFGQLSLEEILEQSRSYNKNQDTTL